MQRLHRFSVFCSTNGETTCSTIRSWMRSAEGRTEQTTSQPFPPEEIHEAHGDSSHDGPRAPTSDLTTHTWLVTWRPRACGPREACPRLHCAPVGFVTSPRCGFPLLSTARSQEDRCEVWKQSSQSSLHSSRRVLVSPACRTRRGQHTQQVCLRQSWVRKPWRESHRGKAGER